MAFPISVFKAAVTVKGQSTASYHPMVPPALLPNSAAPLPSQPARRADSMARYGPFNRVPCSGPHATQPQAQPLSFQHRPDHLRVQLVAWPAIQRVRQVTDDHVKLVRPAL